MRTIVTLLAILTVSSTTFAGSKDLKTLNTLLKAGVASEQFMSQVHIGLSDIDCAYSNLNKAYGCDMKDMSANDGEGAEITLTGDNAKLIYDLLAAEGAPSDGGMGKSFLSAKSIRCTQAVEGVADGSAAERTLCFTELSAAE